MADGQIQMTRAFQLSRVKCLEEKHPDGPSFGLCHHSIIMVSSWVIHALTLAIRVYQLTLSPALTFLSGPAGGCRFTPTCSQYATEALRRHGALPGSWLAAKRICRCHPWGGCGHDPVPERGTRPVASPDPSAAGHS